MNKLTIDKITSYIGYIEMLVVKFSMVIDSNLLKWMCEGDSVGSLNTLSIPYC